MNLHDFELGIEHQILERGLDYFENDFVETVESIGFGEIEATVFGTEDYRVYLKIDGNNNLLNWDCSCPYDWGPICKHVVAVLYYLRENPPENLDQSEELWQASALLEQLNAADIKDFFAGMLKKDRELRRSFLDFFEA